MNSDFEKRLKRQPLREIPSDWKKDILSTATQAAEGRSVPIACSWWRELLWPCPQAWGALAAVWVVIFGLQFASRQSGTPQSIQVVDATAPTVFALYRENQMLAQSDRHLPAPTPAAEPPKVFVPRPRSEFRITTVV